MWLRSMAFVPACLAGLAVLTAQPSGASNGMNLIGYGARSLAMGGADLAVTESAAAMNINPAGIGWRLQPELDLGLGVMNPSLTHTDRLGNDREDSLDRYPMPFLGYVHPVGRFTLGVGLFVQGGLGVEYRNLATPFAALASSGMFPPGFFGNSVIPSTDDVKTQLLHSRFTPAVAWRASPTVTLGATLNVSYARAEMKFLPETSVLADLDGSGRPGDSPADVFSGLRVDDVSALAYGLRLGLQYRKGPMAIGAAVSTETDLDFEDGTLTMNLAALGLGKVAYDARMENFSWPLQAGVGAAYQVHPRLLIAADLDWIGWSSAIKALTIRADNPDRPMAPASRAIPFLMNWEDQWVWALGLEVTAGPKWAARFGFNHGESPIPSSTLRPQFPAIADDHLTGGFGYRTGPWTLDFALEYVPEVSKTNQSFDRRVNPFGPGSTETLSQYALHFSVRRQFGSPRP